MNIGAIVVGCVIAAPFIVGLVAVILCFIVGAIAAVFDSIADIFRKNK